MKQVQLVQMPTNVIFSEVDKIQAVIEQFFHEHSKPKRLILDFARTNFIDSCGIVYLRQICQTARDYGIDLVGWSLSPRIQNLILQAQLDRLLQVDTHTETIIRENRQKLKQLVHPSVYSKTKRIIDIAGAIVGLGITLIVFIPIAILIELESSGPILFSQIRCGYQGRNFRIWKFRSMVTNASQLKHLVDNQVEGAFFKNANDPRITNVGRFLRKTSLDELPQFWNVLRGEMSLVGTRPPTLDEVEKYEIQHGKRLDVKPGLTGEWQVNGRSKIVDFEAVVSLDLQYQKNWSVLYDLKLILKTIQVIFSRNSGAC